MRARTLSPFCLCLTVACGVQSATDGELERAVGRSLALQQEDEPSDAERLEEPNLVAVQPALPPWHTQLIGTSAPDLALAVAVNPGQTANIVHAGNTMDALAGPFLGGITDAYVVGYDRAGNVVWSDQFGTSGDDGITAVVCDKQGNVYVAGFTEESLSVALNSNPGTDDLFVRKYDAAGSLQWTSQFGGMGEDTPSAIALDSNGDLFVAGTTDAPLPGAVHAGARDVFLVKYSAAGSLIGVREAGGASDDVGTGLAIGHDDTLHVSGFTTGVPAGVPPGGFDVFVLKLDPAMNDLWRVQRGTAQDDLSFGIAVNQNLDVFVVGSSTGNFAGINQGGADMIVLSFDSSGTFRWSDQRGTAATDTANGVKVTGAGGPFIVGFTGGNLDGQPNLGGDDVFVMAHGAGGLHRWTTLLGSATSEYGSGIALGGLGFEYVVGYTDGPLDGQPNAGSFDGFTAKFDALGVLQ